MRLRRFAIVGYGVPVNDTEPAPTQPAVYTEIVAMPCGLMEGAPCMAISIGPGITADVLRHAVVADMRPGLSCLLLRSAPWGDPALEHALVSLAGDERFADHVIAAVLPLEAERWANLALHWIADLSRLLRETTTLDEVQKRLGRLVYIPPICELVVYAPAIECVTPRILDPLYEYLNPSGAGVIYGPSAAPRSDADENREYESRALQQLTRCSTPWAIRRGR